MKLKNYLKKHSHHGHARRTNKMNGGTIIVNVSDYNRLCEMVNSSITYLPHPLKHTATEQLNVIVNRYKKAQPYEEDN